MKRPFEVPAELYPFQDHWFERDGTHLHYVDHGEGPPVVMLHGNPTWSLLYRDVIGALDGVRCLAPDYPGFGMSEHPPGYGYTPPEHAEWIAAWLDHLALDPFVLVVQDWGGPIGLSVAIDRPDQVRGLVILNTWAWPPGWFMRSFSWLAGGPLGPLLHQRFNVFVNRILPSSMATRADKPPALWDAYRAPFPDPASRRGTYVFPRAIRQHDDWLAGIEAGLARLADKPVHLIIARKDPAFGGDSTLDHWKRLFPGAPVTDLPDANHYVQEDAPGEIAAAIRGVLDA